MAAGVGSRYTPLAGSRITACSLTRKGKHPSMELGGDIRVADTPGKRGVTQPIKALNLPRRGQAPAFERIVADTHHWCAGAIVPLPSGSL